MRGGCYRTMRVLARAQEGLTFLFGKDKIVEEHRSVIVVNKR